ncbi:MAG: transglutaminase domain-containing protein [Sedimentisphaerales bacterium]|nr:transglutaminase domain-containing protein [Sedimentisphaerales bacterium]
MKTKLFLVISILLAIFVLTSCKDKSSPQPNDSNTPKDSVRVQTPPATAPGTTIEPAAQESKPAIADSADKQSEADEIEYFALYMDKKKSGYAIQKRNVDAGIVKTSIELSLTVSRVGVSVSITTTSSTTETIDGKPLGFEIEQDLGLFATKTIGTIDENGKLVVMEGAQKRVLDYPQGALMSEGMRLLHFKTGLKEGASYKAKMFEPSTMSAFDVEVNVGAKQQVDLLGRIVELTEIKTKASSSQVAAINSDEYYDDELKLQKSITPVLGIMVEQVACSKEFALGKNDVYEIVDKMFLASPQSIRNISSVKSITYHITKTSQSADLQFPATDNQKVEKLSNGNVILTIEKVEMPKGIGIPYKGNDPEALKAMEPSRYVESNEEIIKNLAKKAIGNSKDAAEAALKIESFVADYIEDKNLSVGYASAAEVASSRQGDCTEHAVLTAGLCRAAGIPSRVVTGLAYVAQWKTVSNGFGGHAWTQVYIGDKWYNIDAAFKGAGLGGYDPGHITLSIGNGNPEDFLNIVNTLGQFKIEKIEVEN